MILIAKKQRLARQSAKTLIDFENIVVDTDFGGALSFRSMAIDGGRANLSGDPDDIVIEMANKGDDEEAKRTTDLNNKARLRSKINAGRSAAGFGRGNSQGSSSGKGDGFGDINHYVIDDDEEEEENSQSRLDSHRSEEEKGNNDSQNRSDNSHNTTPREIVFEIDDE